ncbi:MAG: WD40 repeat domain-containing protein [Cyanobacteria bacterium J055]|nr:MAG: WD40 repeat domain-containing protein [Cyanobacteria bacterium J055]
MKGVAFVPFPVLISSREQFACVFSSKFFSSTPIFHNFATFMKSKLWSSLFALGATLVLAERAIAFSPNSANRNTEIVQSQLPTDAQLVNSFQLFGEPTMCRGFSLPAFAVSSDSQSFAVMAHGFTERLCGGGESNLTLWNLATGKKIKTLLEGGVGEAFLMSPPFNEAEPNDITALAGDLAHDLVFTPDGKMLVGALSEMTIKLWDSKTGEVLQTLSGHRAAVRSIAITPDGQTLISGSSDKTIKFWDLKTGRVTRTLTETYGIQEIILSPDGQSLLSIANDNEFDPTDAKINLWDVKTGKLIRDFYPSREVLRPIIFSQDSKTIISASPDNSIKLWDARKGIRMLTLKSHTDRLHWLATTPDGLFLASSSYDGQVKLWNFPDRKFIRTIPIETGFALLKFSPDGRILAIGTGGDVQLWNWRIPEKYHSIAGDWALDFTLDGQTVLVNNSATFNIDVWRYRK